MKEYGLFLGKTREQNCLTTWPFFPFADISGMQNMGKNVTLNWFLDRSFWPVLSLLFQGEEGGDNA